jgi:hypothetical protein
MDKIYIEGVQLDSSEVFSTMVSYLIDDIKDFGSRNCSVSKTIILPGTKHNNKVFGGIYNISSFNNYDSTKPNVNLNFNASVKAQVHVFRDNLQAIKGVAQLLAINIVDGFIDYELGITGELGGFVSALGSSKLEDLDFSAYDHTYSIANIVGSKTNVGSGSGYVYPLIDYGTYSTDKNNWKYKTFRPALFVKEYIDKIFTASGYSYDCDLFSTARFKGLVVPHNQKTLVNNTDLYFQSSRLNQIIIYSASTKNIEFNVFTVLGNFTYQTYLIYYQKIKYNGATDIVFNISVVSNGVTDVGAVFKIYKNGVSDATKIHQIIAYVDSDFKYVINTTFLNITLSTNDFLVFSFSNPYIEIEKIEVKFIGAKKLPIPINLGEQLPINDTILKNILQKDFISWICKLFNLLVYEDNFKDKHLRLAPFSSDGIIDGFYKDADSDNWTNYLDLSSAIKIKPMGELNARYYEFNFKDDSDYYNDLYKKRYNKAYGSYKYDSQYQFSKESQKVEIGFSPTPLLGYDGVDKVYSTIFKRTGTDAAPVEENTDSNIRILQTKVISGVSSWNILDGATVLGSYTDYLYAGHFDDPDAPTNDINFGVPEELFFKLFTGALNVNQFNVYWSAYLAELTDKDARLVTATFKLPLKEISNLDFSKYKYVSGVLYRLNKITDYNISREDTCSVELIKVTNKIY